MAVRTKTEPQLAQPIPAALEDVALVSAEVCAGTGGMCRSWWECEVRAGRAPQPAIRMPRCTRWRLTDVRDFWIERAAQTAGGVQAAELMSIRAKRASEAAQAKRAARVATESVSALAPASLSHGAPESSGGPYRAMAVSAEARKPEAAANASATRAAKKRTASGAAQ